jgi:hypothetical protein
MTLFAFDGTWNQEKAGDDPRSINTNVVRFFRAYDQHTQAANQAPGTVPVENFYVAGVGTRFDLAGKALGGLFGIGALARIEEAYAHLCQAWTRGDTTIDIVGFSRGAAMALDFCHHVQSHGIRAPGTSMVVNASPEIRFLGLWDVVAAFGLANVGNQVLNFGHHLELPRKNLKYCFHALALDERRLSFLPTRLPGACEVWFRGVHADVGGGNGNRGLNDFALRWMMRKAQASGLPIADADCEGLQPQMVEPRPALPLHLNVRPIAAVDRRHYSVSPMNGWTTPPATCPVESEGDEAAAKPVGEQGIELLSQAVRHRMSAMWDAADTVARTRGFTLDQAQLWLLTLIEGRVLLVQTEADLTRARSAMGLLVSTAIDGCVRRDYHVLVDFFLNEALFSLPHLFPLTD